MSMQTYVFLKRENLPRLDVLQNSVREFGFDYELPIDMDLNQSEASFIPGSFENLASGFDYLAPGYNPDDWEWTTEDLTLLREPDFICGFNTFSNAQEIAGMLAVAASMTVCSDGVMLSDFFHDELIPSSSVLKFAKNKIEASRDQFSGPSKLRRCA